MRLSTLLATLCVAARAQASPLDCQTIHDHDRRNVCLAEANRDRAYCELVHDHDLRDACRARVQPRVPDHGK